MLLFCFVDGMFEVFQATSEERTSNPKWSDTQILSKLTLVDGDLLFEFLDIEGLTIAVFK